MSELDSLRYFVRVPNKRGAGKDDYRFESGLEEAQTAAQTGCGEQEVIGGGDKWGRLQNWERRQKTNGSSGGDIGRPADAKVGCGRVNIFYTIIQHI